MPVKLKVAVLVAGSQIGSEIEMVVVSGAMRLTIRSLAWRVAWTSWVKVNVRR